MRIADCKVNLGGVAEVVLLFGAVMCVPCLKNNQIVNRIVIEKLSLI
jgi:hypothetical protein